MTITALQTDLQPSVVADFSNVAITWNHSDDRRQETPCERQNSQTEWKDGKMKDTWLCTAKVMSYCS